MKIISTIIFTFISLAFFAGTTNAQEASRLVNETQPQMVYFVSAVLRKADTESTIKLIQCVQIKSSSEDAVEAMLHQVAIEFSGYVVLTTLVSPLSSLAPTKPSKTIIFSNV